jgi:hypothetical protein
MVSKLMPAVFGPVFGLIGVFCGGLINDRLLRKNLDAQTRLARDAADNARDLAEAKAKQEREFSERRGKLEIGNSFVQWQLKQLSERCVQCLANRMRCIVT